MLFWVILVVGICLAFKIKFETLVGFFLAFLLLAVMLANGK
jgi:hypothetical protein